MGLTFTIGCIHIDMDAPFTINTMNDAWIGAQEQDESNGGPGFPKKDLQAFCDYALNNHKEVHDKFAEYLSKLRESKYSFGQTPYKTVIDNREILAKKYGITNL